MVVNALLSLSFYHQPGRSAAFGPGPGTCSGRGWKNNHNNVTVLRLWTAAYLRFSSSPCSTDGMDRELHGAIHDLFYCTGSFVTTMHLHVPLGLVLFGKVCTYSTVCALLHPASNHMIRARHNGQKETPKTDGPISRLMSKPTKGLLCPRNTY